MFRMMTIAIGLILGFSITPGLEVRTNPWSGGTEFHFTFSENECQKLAESWSYSSEKAGEIVSEISEGFRGSGGGIILAIGIAQVKITSDLQRFSKEYIHEFGEPVSWTYSLRRRDNWRGFINLLDAVAEIWRKAAIGY